MKKSTNVNVGVLVVVAILLVAAALLWRKTPEPEPTIPTDTPPVETGEAPTSTAAFACNDDKTVNVSYYDERAVVTLSDGRTLDLPQVVAAEGARYANADESFAFWTNGNGALVLEDTQERSYFGCILVRPSAAGLENTYQSGIEGITVRYPAGYTADDAYAYEAFGPSKTIVGTKFTIAPSVAEGTNLSDDSYVSVEFIPGATSCRADLFLPDGPAARSVTDGGTTYSVASSTGAAAGNRYEETVYAIPGTLPCIGIRSMVHYGVLENYPEGTVKAFDTQALISTFDAVRRSLVVNQ